MNRHLPSALAAGAVATIALVAAAVMVSLPAYADDITVEPSSFVGSRTREEVDAELKTPWPGGNPWSGSYNMFQGRSTATSEQVQGEYLRARDQANAMHKEDSGSLFIIKAPGAPAAGTTPGAMGAAAR